MNQRPLIAMILAYLVPGAGHLFLGRRARGAAFFAIVVTLFIVGIAIDGSIYTFADSQRQLLRQLATLGSLGSGLVYFIATMTGPYGKVIASTFEYGTMFTLSAGLMNLLLVIDCYDIAQGRKE
ncbi:MAG TPA: DUF6677 family protein [Thermoanaerobaculia bacterium]|jgi:TM2 domain-containing membrane protein YozV